MRVSFDYLVNALQSLDDKVYRSKEELPHAKLALNEREALMRSGLVEDYQKRSEHDSRLGRFRKSYRLTKPYSTITVRNLITPTFPRSKFDRHIFRKLGTIKLTELDRVVLTDVTCLTSIYSAEKLIRCLGGLSANYYIPLQPRLYRITSTARKIMTDMVNLGIVSVRHNGTVCEYKLSAPLTDVSIEVLLPYLYSASAYRLYYNRLFSAAKDLPIALLLTSY